MAWAYSLTAPSTSTPSGDEDGEDREVGDLRGEGLGRGPERLHGVRCGGERRSLARGDEEGDEAGGADAHAADLHLHQVTHGHGVFVVGGGRRAQTEMAGVMVPLCRSAHRRGRRG